MKVIYSIATRIGGTGLGITSYNTVKALSSAGYLQKAVCYGNRSDLDQRSILALPGNPAKLLFFLPRHYYRPLRKGFLDYVTSQMILSKGCDVFHGWHSQALRSVKAAKKTGAAAIVESGSNHPAFRAEVLAEEFSKFGLEAAKTPDYVKRASLEELALADYLFVISDFAKETYVRAGIDRAKIMVVGRGADLARFRPAEKRDEKFRVLFMGRIGVRKGVHYLLEAWRDLGLRDAELVLAGTIEENFRPLLAQYADLKNVVYTGFIKNPEDAYAKASVFAFPSLEEGGAKVTYEAMACGLPLITTENSASVIRDGTDGFIIPIRDSRAIREKILFFYENRGEISRMGMHAAEQVTHHSWECFQKRVIDTYRRLFGT